MAKPDADRGDGTARGNSKRGPQVTISKSVSETVNGSHLYSIKGYSLSKGMGTGKYMSSETFTVGGYQWAIYFYPDGKNPEDGALYVSVFIALASDGTDVRALFELTLLDQSGKEKHKVHSHFDRALESGPYTLKYKGSMWYVLHLVFLRCKYAIPLFFPVRGYKRFFRRTALEASDYIKDDCLAMRCTVGVVRTRMEAPRQFSVAVPPSDMGKCLGKLLDSGLGSDVVFEIGEESLKAHKLILAARSPVFRAQFFGLVGDPKAARVAVEDMDPGVFKAMLQYVYTDELPEGRETVLLQHLLAAADRYGLDRLKSLCEQRLCGEIAPDTVAATLALAEQHQCVQLKAACLKYAAVPSNLGGMKEIPPLHSFLSLCRSLSLSPCKDGMFLQR